MKGRESERGRLMESERECGERGEKKGEERKRER